MKVYCLYNTGEALRSHEYNSLEKATLGRFGATGYSEYGGVTVGREYFVMGMIMFESYLGYLLDDNGLISVCPAQLFKVTDHRLSSKWKFRLIDKEESIYPFVQAIWGYDELCLDKMSYEKLIIEHDEDTQFVYFKRKMELEQEVME